MIIDNPPGLTEQVADESVHVCECGFIILQIKTDEGAEHIEDGVFDRKEL